MRRRTSRKFTCVHQRWVASTLAVGLWSSTAAAGDDLSAMADELARLRSQVESLSGDLDRKKEDTRSKIRALANQKASLEAEIQREELRVKQLDQELARVRERLAAAGDQEADLKPVIIEEVERLDATVTAGLPFRVEDRRDALRKIGASVKDGTLAPSRAATRVWAWIEDELRLTRENGLYRQVISVAGSEVLADVARLGMTMMYFRTPDGRLGYAADDGQWRYEVVTDPEGRAHLEDLFTAFEKRIRTGYFALPAAIPTRALNGGSK